MLYILQQFVVNSIELTIFMILWSMLSLKAENSWLKNLFIILLGSSVMTATTSMNACICVCASTCINTCISTFISYLSFIFLIKFIYKRSLIRTILEFFIFLCTDMVLQAILIKFVSLIGYKYTDSFGCIIIIIIIELFLVGAILRCISNKKAIIIFELDSRIIYYFVTNLGIYALVSKLVWQYNKYIILDNMIAYISILSLMLAMNLVFYYYIFKIIEDKKILEVQNKYDSILVDIVEETRRKQHDFKNYLNVINAIVEIASEKEIKHELKKFIASSKGSNKGIEDIMYIDNIIIKAIIFNKLCEADRLGIKFLFSVTNNSLENCLNAYEISDILNNLLNNAFEAVTDLTNDKTVILNILSEGDTNIVEVRNSGITITKDNIENIFERGYSSKKGENRGYGLYNIKKIAEKNGSDVQLFFENNYTGFKILFK